MSENKLVSLLLFFKNMSLIGPTLYAKCEWISFPEPKDIGSQRPKIDFLSSKFTHQGLKSTPSVLNSTPKELKLTARGLKFWLPDQNSPFNGKKSTFRGSKLTFKGPTLTPRVKKIDCMMPTILSQWPKTNSQIANLTSKSPKSISGGLRQVIFH